MLPLQPIVHQEKSVPSSALQKNASPSSGFADPAQKIYLRLRARNILRRQQPGGRTASRLRTFIFGGQTLRQIIIAALLSSATTLAIAAEPIEGKWKTASGETAAISSCGGGFCVTLKTGKYAGKRIGKLEGTGNDYSGEITDPAEDKTYSGYGTVSGDALVMKGCVLKVLCKSQTWKRL
jgi:uncharacterized protein (DUF2147 family)